MSINVFILIIVSVSVLHMWFRRSPNSELEWVLGITVTLVLMGLWQSLIAEWLY
jgi:hypothetical protein